MQKTHSDHLVGGRSTMEHGFMKLLCLAAAIIMALSFAGCSSGQTQAGSHLVVTQAEIAVGGHFLLATDLLGEVEWTSSDEAVATVENGMVTGRSAGTATVTATNGRSLSTCEVTVKEQKLDFKMTLADATLAVGDVLRLSATGGSGVIWTSSDEAVATVKDGVVTARGAGTATVTAKFGEAILTCTVTVIPPASTPQEPSGGEGGSQGGESGRTLVWYDEFDGTSLDETKWEYQLGRQDVYGSSQGPMAWGNNELQAYTREAVALSDGVMKITARREQKGDAEFTSARITTRDRGYWTYGYFEAKMKLPEGNGMWPAFWMLPQPSTRENTSNEYGGWAASGEIDIMEARGRMLNEVGGTIHFGGPWPGNKYLTQTKQLSSPITEWHVYAIDWRANYMAWLVDGEEYFRLENTAWNSTAAPDSETAPFDVNFYLLFDLAVGGNYDNGIAPDASFVSAAMEVDYVRVYA